MSGLNFEIIHSKFEKFAFEPFDGSSMVHLPNKERAAELQLFSPYSMGLHYGSFALRSGLCQ